MIIIRVSEWFREVPGRKLCVLVEEGGLREVSSVYGIDSQAFAWAGKVGVLILLTFAFLDFGMINVRR